MDSQSAKDFMNYLTTQSAPVEMLGFLINLGLAALLGAVLGWVYGRFGTTLSNRSQFASNFILLATTTMLVITVIKYSIALSLGLVGALSIVRFRAAIKEPEELAYLFLAISIGLGLGADQRNITVIAFAFIVAMLWLRRWGFSHRDAKDLYLDVSIPHAGDPGRNSAPALTPVLDILREHFREVDLKRFDQSSAGLDVSCLVSMKDLQDLDRARSALRVAHPDSRITFLDSRGLAA